MTPTWSRGELGVDLTPPWTCKLVLCHGSFRQPIYLSSVIPDSVDAVCGEGGVPGELGEGLRQPLTVRSLRLGLHQEANQLAVRVLQIGGWGLV